MMKRLSLALLIALAVAGTATAQGSLSNQVLRLLSRINTWSALQTYTAGTGVILLGRQSAPLGTRTDRLENIGGNLYFNGTVLASSSSAGTVTSIALATPSILSVSGSPITSSGTITLSLATQTANTVWAGPTTGSAATPTFRALVDADIPDAPTISCTNCVTWASVNKTGSSLADLTTKSAAALTSGTLPDARFPATLPALSGVNLTSLNATQLMSGTLPDARFPSTLPALDGSALTNLNANALNSGEVPAAQMPAFTGDAPSSAGTVDLTLTNTAVTPDTYGDATHVGVFTVDSKGRITSASEPAITFPTVVLTSGVSGILPQANGGTGITTAASTNGQILIGRTDTGALTLAAITGTSNQVVVTNGAASITLSLPQSIATTSTPQFARLGLGTGAGASAVITTTGQIDTGYFANGNSGTTKTIDWSAGMVQKITLNGNVTFTYNNPISGVAQYRLDLTQDGSGSRTVTWPGTITWRTGVAPTLTTTAGKTDICTFRWTGAVYYGECSLNY